MIAIETRGLRKSFRGDFLVSRNEALRGVDLQVQPAQIFGFLGHNGAGKTTTIKIVVGLIFATSGEALLFGRRPSEPAARARLGFLPEQPSFPDYLTGRELLAYYGGLLGIPRAERPARIAEVLEATGMTAAADGRLRRYSKGMIQRIGIAQALLNDPDLLILDEPMEGLDPIGRRQIRDLLLDLRARGKTIFFSSHILQDAEMICDRVAILAAGRVVRQGNLEELLTDEKGPTEVRVSGLAPGREPAGTRVLHRSLDHTLLLAPDAARLDRTLADLRAAGASVVSATPQRRSLEDLFLEEVRAAGSAPGGPA